MPEPTYHQHLVSVHPGSSANYFLACSCQWTLRLAARDDVAAAEAALDHVKAMRPPTIEELFDRL